MKNDEEFDAIPGIDSYDGTLPGLSDGEELTVSFSTTQPKMSEAEAWKILFGEGSLN